MLRLGEIQKLQIVKRLEFGAYLAQQQDPGVRVLLPAREVPQEAQVGDTLSVFVYRDSKDRPICTRREPAMTLGHTALLRVREVTKVGAFLDWGLEKDLLLPFHEQTRKVQTGELVLCALYLDKSERLCATMNVYPYLQKNSPYGVDDIVEGRVYETSQNFGVFVAVDDRYSALIPRREPADQLQIGDVIEARVTAVKEDGKLDLSRRRKAYQQIDEDAAHVLEIIRSYDGVLPFSDGADPERIRQETGLSKNAFKRAVGHLLKEGKIILGGERISLKE